MLRNSEFVEWCAKNNLSQPSIELISRIRNSEPSRTVGGGVRNVAGRFPSKRMGRTLQFESHKVELPILYELEHSKTVHEIYDQPEQIKLEYLSASGRQVSVLHTPDFFVINIEKAGWIECKREDELCSLSKDMPNRYVQIDGIWRCPPGEAFAAKLGLYYAVKSSKDINWFLQRNTTFLSDYMVDAKTELSMEKVCDIISIVKANPAISLIDLISEPDSDADTIYYMIVRKILFVDLESCDVGDPRQCNVFVDKETALAHSILTRNRKTPVYKHEQFIDRIGEKIDWDGKPWTIVNIGDSSISLLSEDGSVALPKDVLYGLVSDGRIKPLDDQSEKDFATQAMSILSKASPDDIAEANRRYEIIYPVLKGGKIKDINICVSKRTVYNWVASYKQAEQQYGYGFIGLLPSFKNRGNREPHLPKAVIEAAHEFLDLNLTLTNQSIKALYGKFIIVCSQKGLIIPSRKTFGRILSLRDKHNTILKTQGKRAAYQEEQFFNVLEMTTPRHGQRPFETVHIDHTPLDLETTHSETGKNLGKVWHSIMMDAFSRRTLAHCVLFNPPSIDTIIILLRECVRRFNRLPSTIITDNGKEFKSVYYQSFLACFGVEVKYRPAHSARFGSVGERLFGTEMTQLIWNLRGNTKITKTPRQATKSNNPKTLAVWNVPYLRELLDDYHYEFYDTQEHPALGESPRDAFSRVSLTSGERKMRYIPFSQDFIMMTLPSVSGSGGTRKVDIQRGIQVNNIRYYSDELNRPYLDNTDVQVRYDPWDVSVVYCFISGCWIKCYSEHWKDFRGRSLNEILIASQELRKQKALHFSAENVAIRAEELAAFLMKAEQTEEMLIQRLKDSEMASQMTLVTVRDNSVNTKNHMDSVRVKTSSFKPIFDGESVIRKKG